MAVQASRLFPSNHEHFDTANAWVENVKIGAGNQRMVRVRTPSDNLRPVLSFVSLQNDGSGVGLVGVGPELRFSKWIAGQWDDAAAGNDFTDDSVDAQDAGTNDFPLTTTTDNDGFVVGATERFSCVEVTLTTAAGGGVPVYEYTYWNGSSWATLTTLQTLTFTPAGTYVLLFDPPADWAASSGGSPGEGIGIGYFLVRVRATTAPTVTAAAASQIRVGDPFRVSAEVAAAGVLTVSLGKVAPCDMGEGLQVAWGVDPAATSQAVVAGEDFES